MSLRSPLCGQNFWFLVKNEGGFDENKFFKKPHSSEKTPVLKTRNAITGILYSRKWLYRNIR